MSMLSLENVTKSYGDTTVLRDVSLSIEDGEFVAIVGFSGSGKSTLVNLMAGLALPDAGAVRFRGEPVREPAPERGVVFQSYSLMPWLTVTGNVRLAVDAAFPRLPARERAEKTAHYVRLVGLSHARDRRPSELSGGMRQRVGIARALAAAPDILLLDEPLSALDALTRANLQDEIARIRAEENTTIVLITNDVDEAILLADRIIPLDPGRPGEASTLGPEFPVDLPAPRDRSALNDNPRFTDLRSRITQWLMAAGPEAATGQTRNLPKVEAVHPLPRAYSRAAHAFTDERYLEFSQVDKVYPTPNGPLKVVDGFDLKMRKGEFVSLIGHSGCGKSTVLTMAAGLNSISSGGVILGGREIDGAGPDRAVVFQSPSLFPWLTARENVALGVDKVYPDANRAERQDIVEYYLERVGLADAMHKPAADLSNGMRQRVGIARAFALSPRLLLLDEPFGMLDSLTRWELQSVLMEVWSRTQVTTICVTHDVDEAILLADRVVMMTNGPEARIGKIMEIDLPRPRIRRELVRNPAFYAYRAELLAFLREYEHGAHADKEAA
jgi:nitrate/nitrite transport system ATP-binding protein